MTRHVEIRWRGRAMRVEIGWVGAPDAGPAGRPLLVFLHEGLGSLAMWKDYPQRLCEAVGARGLVYSRPGYGRSTPRAAHEAWASDFMHQQAHEVLPAVLEAAGIDAVRDRPWLFGHSDGGSISLLYAAQFPDQLAGAIVVAPHILVEDVSIASIEKAREAWQTTDLRQRLARYHDDPGSAFGGWNGIWLDPAFRTWSIEDEIRSIRCPLLAIQGIDDEYGTLEQIRGIARRLPQTELAEIPDCGHSPHRDQPEVLTAAVLAFLKRHSG